MADGIVILDEETVGEYVVTPPNGILIAFSEGRSHRNVLELAAENGIALSFLAMPVPVPEINER